MELRGPLASLRHDDIEWKRGQQGLVKSLAAWRAEPVAAPVFAAMKRFGGGAALERCRALADLFAPPGERAEHFVASLIDAGIAALDGYPLGQLPLRHGSRDAAPMLVLAQSGDATLALAAHDGGVLAMLPPARTARFRPVETWVRVLSGSGVAERVLLGEADGVPAAIGAEQIALGAGDVRYHHGPHEAFEVVGASGAMIVLRLERQLEECGLVREYAMPGGVLVHQAGARPDDSRDELIVALLGGMGRIDAVPQMARVVLGDGSDALRWQALREVTALDGAAGLELLAQIAADPEDTLAAQAGAALAALLASRPDLEGAGTWPG